MAPLWNSVALGTFVLCVSIKITMSALFKPVTVGAIQLGTRVVMSPMTRSRAVGNEATDLMGLYYAQRAGPETGMIIVEGVSPSPNGLGYSRIPAIYDAKHVSAWKKITSAVQAKGTKIVLQIMHTGRVSHPLNLPANGKVLAPSAIACGGAMWTDQQQMQPFPVPTEMTKADIATAIDEHAKCAELAIAAGFDGVELHGANGYLVEQFLNPACNARTDEYGVASPSNKMRFALEVRVAIFHLHRSAV